MNISFNQTQRMDQRLVMTRQMIQSIELLQLPLMDLQQNINSELVSNPWLEPVDEAKAERLRKEKDAANLAAQAAPAQQEPEDPRIKRLEALMKDWNDPAARPTGSGFRGGEDSKLEAMQNTAARAESLEEHLLPQLHMLKEDPSIIDKAEVIIGSLDENGYMKQPVLDLFYRTDGGFREELIEGGCTPEEAELALEVVQSLEPAGVGAHDLKECLLLQLQRAEGDTLFEEKLVENHLDDLHHNRLPKIARDMNCTVERVKEGLSRLRRLNPLPGRAFASGRPQYVTPDIIVEENGGTLDIRVNESQLPPLRISRDTMHLLKTGGDGEAKEYMMGKLGSAVWLLESVLQRRNTLQRIAREIVERQAEFFEHGPSKLKPLMMNEIAEKIGMHVSTVSRAIAGKYMQTPQGLFSLKYFFTSGIPASDGADAESNRAIMSRIEDMIKGEDKRNPLSDQEMVERLQAEGLDIARRTIAKYREKLNVPSSRQRRAY